MMKRAIWIGLAAVAGLLLLFGLYRANLPQTSRETPAEAQMAIEDLATRFSAAMENERDVTPLAAELAPLVARHPTLRAGHQLLGQMYAHQNRIPEAYGQFQAALQLGDADAALHNLTGTAAQMLGDREAAAMHYLRSIELNPDDPKLKLALADLRLKQQNFEDARLLVLAALDQQPGLWEADALLSDVYFARGQATQTPADYRLALDPLERALGKLPMDEKYATQRVAYARKLARTFAALGDAMESLAVLDSLEPSQRFSPGVLVDMAGYFESLNQTALAGLQYAMAAEAMPNDPYFLVEAARWYAKGGDEKSARLMLGRLAERWPEHPALDELSTIVGKNP